MSRLPKLANVVEWDTPQVPEIDPVPGTVSKREKQWVLLWALAIVGLSSLPYLAAWQLAPEGTHYTGLLINHYDGESYYAKMQQGARGEWLFHLAFTPEPHDGAFIFAFYLALGHVATILGLSIPFTYHLARVAAGLFFLLVAYRFLASFFPTLQTRRAAFLLLGFSSGLGWLLGPLGLATADLWVAEGLTFLSIFANPHFPLAMALMLLIFLSVLDVLGERVHVARILWTAGLGLLLAVVQPFAVPIVLAVLGVTLAAVACMERQVRWGKVTTWAAALAGAAPIMIYDLYVYQANPALAAWSAQNLTPSLPPWDYALGYGLILVLALGGAVFGLRRRQPGDLFLLSWVGTAVLLLYMPFALQRRFITGLHVPLTALAALGLEQVIWPRIRPARRSVVTALIVGFTLLTNLFVSAVTVAGVAQGRAQLVMTAEEAAASTWLQRHSHWTDTVIAPPGSGQFIPAWAGNRVVYGHPFETIEAQSKEAEVVRFYSPTATDEERRALLDRYDVRYVLSLSPENVLNSAALSLTPVWREGEAILYRVETAP